MRIEIEYADKVELFDTALFTANDPFAGDSDAVEGGRAVIGDVTFECEPEKVASEGLFAVIHYYSTDPEAKEACSKSNFVAPLNRRKGYRALLVGPVEADSVEAVSLDGRLVLARVDGELMDVRAVERGHRVDEIAQSIRAYVNILRFSDEVRSDGRAVSIPGIPQGYIDRIVEEQETADAASCDGGADELDWPED